MPDHMALQYAFAAHLRNPEKVPAPEGIEDRRMAIYRRLFFNNIFSFLGQAFPVLSQTLGPEPWRCLVRRFYAEHRSQQAQFYRLAEEFVHFLDALDDTDLPPFSAELGHYEWIELALSVAPGGWPECDPLKQVAATDQLVFTPYLELLSYVWPVQRICAGFQPAQAPEQATFLMVYRDCNEDVQFKQLNPLTTRLIELLVSQDAAVESVVQTLSQEARMPREVLTPAALETLNSLVTDGVVLGRKRAQ